MKFQKAEARTRFVVTPAIIGAAKRALKKEREKAGLFGEELMAFTTVEERLAWRRERHDDFGKRIRDFEAKAWREARANLRRLPPESKSRVLDAWNSERRKAPLCATNMLHEVRSVKLADTTKSVSVPAKKRAAADDRFLQWPQVRLEALKAAGNKADEFTEAAIGTVFDAEGAIVFLLRDLTSSLAVIEHEAEIIEAFNNVIAARFYGFDNAIYEKSAVRVDFRPVPEESYILPHDLGAVPERDMLEFIK